MTTQLTIRVIGNCAPAGERVYSSVTSQSFDIFELERLIERVIGEAVTSIGGKNDADLRAIEPEVSIAVTGVGFRPALHLSAALTARLASVGASIDFDPYVWEGGSRET